MECDPWTTEVDIRLHETAEALVEALTVYLEDDPDDPRNDGWDAVIVAWRAASKAREPRKGGMMPEQKGTANADGE